MVNGEGEFVKVSVLAALVVPTAVLGNVRLATENMTGATPVPMRLTTCVPGAALSFSVTAPSMKPRVFGAKLIVNVQVAVYSLSC